ncbi:MAG: early transcription factor VETF large subunit [Faunusvirus sp.]|jgi:hypothetical protein|uniref:Early transcription factor VETF large subunit n=1 Tax=Faunusvirus sp. TaxID=2487766 RepID=A0A3G4ZW53_9VIRU|nr:MAG: early transcription factor VETF large subunit [Faunusvirus sp.]
MDDPIKMIFKYKNSNKRIQYNLYIFVGNLMSQEITNILKKIEDLNLFDTLMKTDIADIKQLEKTYGVNWYTKFFISYHIESTFNNIIKTTRKNDVITKFGDEWYNTHVDINKIRQRSLYSFNYNFKKEREDKDKRLKREKQAVEVTELDVYNDFTTAKATVESKTKHVDTASKMGGVGPPPEVDEYVSDEKFPDEPEINDEVIEDRMEAPEEPEPEMDDDEIDEVDLDELEQMYKTARSADVDVDEDLSTTTKMIRDILPDEETTTSKRESLVQFDESNMGNMYDEHLKNVVKKHYVFHQYLFKDDTIKTVKQKVCASVINNSNIIGDINHISYIMPSRQYMWCEYLYKDNNVDYKRDKVMIGQKWIKRNDLLNIDIEPNENLRVYENLRENLKYLKDNIKKYGHKIKYEDDEFNVLYDYIDFMTLNEIYMIDIYNELGTNYSAPLENLKNIYDVYIKIYFASISFDEFKHIIDYVNVNNKDIKTRKIEINKMHVIYDTIYNDLLLENEIVKTVETTKKSPNLYKDIFKENFVTQSTIHVPLEYITIIKTRNDSKLDLFRIFDNYLLDDKFPFLQYQAPDGQLVFKFMSTTAMTTTIDKDVIKARWFENAPYGISFKVKVDQKGDVTNKYISIQLSENGKMEYKAQWKEEDMATIEDIYKTHDYVRHLLSKINTENTKIQFKLPTNADFKFAFINSIQQLVLPEKFIINHNDLSDFSRYFFPYIALVIEPRKRQSKIKTRETDTSKYGTYLRYKRISKFENKAKIEHRIWYFLRNYEYNEKLLALEIGKQFNITEKEAMEHIKAVIDKYFNFKHARKVLKKFENIPKYKPPGISINIQGKLRNNYKMRIEGARNKDQLDRMITFMNILIYLYMDTYLYKNKDRQAMKDKLKQLHHIAKRRNKVEEIIQVEEEVKTVKHMAKLDSARIGFKPKKGESGWPRACQNSGTEHKRRPQQYTNDQIADLIKAGYALNTKTNQYEKKVTVKKNGKKEHIVRAIKLDSFDNKASIYYTCNVEENKNHMYVGFLSRASNPFGHCMPCCFKKDQLYSKNKEKKNFYLKCLGQLEEKKLVTKKTIGDKLYILQDTNKIQEGRFGFLPKYLDVFMNHFLGKKKVIKNHYLLNTENGYFFKYGLKQDVHPFLTCFGSCYDISAADVKQRLIDALNADKHDTMFTSLNNGDIKTQFGTREKFIKFIMVNDLLDIDIFADFVGIPGIFSEKGVNIIAFEKRTQIITEELEKQKLKEDYFILCRNSENRFMLTDPERDNVIILKEDDKYYPVFIVQKNEVGQASKTIGLNKTYKYDKDKKNIIKHILQYYDISCNQQMIDVTVNSNMITKMIYIYLMGLKQPEYKPKCQVIDLRNKCKYIVTVNDTIIPVIPSGTVYNLPIIYNIDNIIADFYGSMDKLMALSQHIENIKPSGINYDYITNDETMTVSAILIDKLRYLPVKTSIITKSELNSYTDKLGLSNFITQSTPLYDIIDKDIEKGVDNVAVDNRTQSMTREKYDNESYELFRLELSEYLSNDEKAKNKLIKVINNAKINKNEKRVEIRKILYKIVNKEINELYNSIYKIQETGEVEEERDIFSGGNKKDVKDKDVKEMDKPTLLDIGASKWIVNVVDKDSKDLTKYTVKNNREICSMNADKNKCASSNHCTWAHKRCRLALEQNKVIEFIGKVTEELVINSIKANEILKIENYFVSDIVDYGSFTQRTSQKIIKSSGITTSKLLNELFGTGNVPIIGKRRVTKVSSVNNKENLLHPMKKIGNFYIQDIIHSVNTLYRAFSNCYYWFRNSLYDDSYRNIGYYSVIQTDLSNYFKSNVIEWLLNVNNVELMKREMAKWLPNNISEFTNQIIIKIDNPLSYVVELYILNKIYKIPIAVYDNYNKIILIYDDGLIYDDKFQYINDKKIIGKYELNKDVINIQFNYYGSNTYPSSINVLYVV